MMKSSIATLSFFVWLAGYPTQATTGTDLLKADPPVQAVLTRMLKAHGVGYLSAREELLTVGDRAIPILQSRVSTAKWTGDTWRADAAAHAALLWLQKPELASRLYDLRGLKPGVYLQRRLPDPEVGRELQRFVHAAPILVEIYLKTSAQYPFASPDEYPSHFASTMLTELRSREMAALRVGILWTLAKSDYPAAPYLTSAVLTDESAQEGERRIAAIALGESTPRPDVATLDLLIRIAREPNSSTNLVTGALIGIAQHARHQPIGSVRFLRAMAEKSRKLEIKRTAISSLALAAVQPGAGDERSGVIAFLLSELTRPELLIPEQTLFEAMAVVAEPTTTDHLESLQADTNIPLAVRQRAGRAILRFERTEILQLRSRRR